ncbi:Na+/H+ antiporter subunit E [Tenuifilum sp.]|uniref:Na+/H+ antiporter subunit E n=1 Tax=Tenuifilum sp. TaxID=2760880 RepID=UPI001B7A4335|nr:Na+/H+ antiporter subunit E [Bacteroidales bacterium]HOK60600.1 Na+/H+ antiporter subunit E [Tenuifilum sp.]HON69485.1 Na+/H+ antiporter subunit E [Tenuifilum sp.]HOU73201.1 Na+/H+ antiporter subunit E [Tenuifilum sp.]HQE53669.1 Na+/H+ antiporter subunit E [Tenuifilum sp.]
MNIRNVANLFVLLFLIWLLLTGTFELTSLLLGLALAVTLALIFGKNSNVFGRFRMTPKVFVYSLIYLFVLSWEIVKSNIDVALRVLNPKLPINPGIVKVKTRLKSPIGRMILANSITLTPGTLTIDMKDDELYIHWIDVKTLDTEEASRKILGKFEKLLEVIYG